MDRFDLFFEKHISEEYRNERIRRNDRRNYKRFVILQCGQKNVIPKDENQQRRYENNAIYVAFSFQHVDIFDQFMSKVIHEHEGNREIKQSEYNDKRFD